MEVLTVIFGLPVLILVLALPYLIIYVPLRWHRQTKRIQEIERRLERLEDRLSPVFDGADEEQAPVAVD